MGNPARPVTDTPVETLWGLDVADSVVRRYANAAARDADLGPATNPELVGQVVVLTDTGTLQQNCGPVTQWQKPWGTPWGGVYTAVSQAQAASAGTTTVFDTTQPAVAGRLWKISAEICRGATWDPGYVSISGASPLKRVEGTGSGGGGHSGEQTLAYHSYVSHVATTGYRVYVSTTNVTLAGNMGNHLLVVEDIGPAANPTAIVAGPDGIPMVDVAQLAPEYQHLWLEPLTQPAA